MGTFRASSSWVALKPTLGADSFPLFTPLDELFIADFWRPGGGAASAAGVLLGSGASGASALLPAQPIGDEALLVSVGSSVVMFESPVLSTP